MIAWCLRPNQAVFNKILYRKGKIKQNTYLKYIFIWSIWHSVEQTSHSSVAIFQQFYQHVEFTFHKSLAKVIVTKFHWFLQWQCICSLLRICSFLCHWTWTSVTRTVYPSEHWRPFFGGVGVAHRFSFQCFVYLRCVSCAQCCTCLDCQFVITTSIVCLRCVSCAQCCTCLDCQFVITTSIVYLRCVSCAQCCTCLWIVNSWLPPRFSLTFIYTLNCLKR